jgi:hypothetical protein
MSAVLRQKQMRQLLRDGIVDHDFDAVLLQCRTSTGAALAVSH